MTVPSIPSVTSSSSAQSGIRAGGVTTSFSTGDFFIGDGAKKTSWGGFIWGIAAALFGVLIAKKVFR